jgi:hypothetical protein
VSIGKIDDASAVSRMNRSRALVTLDSSSFETRRKPMKTEWMIVR